MASKKTGRPVGRPLAIRPWGVELKIPITVRYDEHPEVHSLIFAAQQNRVLDAVIIEALENYIRKKGMPYNDEAYREQMVSRAIAGDTLPFDINGTKGKHGNADGFDLE